MTCNDIQPALLGKNTHPTVRSFLFESMLISRVYLSIIEPAVQTFKTVKTKAAKKLQYLCLNLDAPQFVPPHVCDSLDLAQIWLPIARQMLLLDGLPV